MRLGQEVGESGDTGTPLGGFHLHFAVSDRQDQTAGFVTIPVAFSDYEVLDDGFLAQLRDELVTFRCRPLRNRQREIPTEGTTKVRLLSIPAIRDRVVQAALPSVDDFLSARTLTNLADLAIHLNALV